MTLTSLSCLRLKYLHQHCLPALLLLLLLFFLLLLRFWCHLSPRVSSLNMLELRQGECSWHTCHHASCRLAEVHAWLVIAKLLSLLLCLQLRLGLKVFLHLICIMVHVCLHHQGCHACCAADVLKLTASAPPAAAPQDHLSPKVSRHMSPS